MRFLPERTLFFTFWPAVAVVLVLVADFGIARSAFMKAVLLASCR